MAQSNVISVNPATSTLGDLNPGATARILRRRVLEQQAEKPSFKKMLDAAFALGGDRRHSHSVSLLLLRSVVGALLITCGLASGFGGLTPTSEVMQSSAFMPSVGSVLQIVAGVSLCLGLLTRVTLSVVSIVAGVVFAMGIAFGVFVEGVALTAALSMVLAVVGPGNVSLDSQIRGAAFHAYRNHARRKAERRLSYEAFRYDGF